LVLFESRRTKLSTFGVTRFFINLSNFIFMKDKQNKNGKEDSVGESFTKGLANGAGKVVGAAVVGALIGFVIAGPAGAAIGAKVGGGAGGADSLLG